MRFWLSPHAVERADQRFGWSPKQATKYWYNHVDWGTFNQGPGVYNVVMGGIRPVDRGLRSRAESGPLSDDGYCEVLQLVRLAGAAHK